MYIPNFFLKLASNPTINRIERHLLVQESDEGKSSVLLAIFLLRDVNIPNPPIPDNTT